MSITVTTDVFCSVPRCNNWTHGVTGQKADPSSARKEAAKIGWVYKNGLDICPLCKKKDA